MLTTEALRQLYAKLGDYAADRVGAIVFASPDIDMDVFTAAIPKIGPLVAKIRIITATDDRALAVSRLVNGTTRIGGAEKTQLEHLGLKVIDTSAQDWGVLNHNLSTATIRKAISDAIAREGSADLRCRIQLRRQPRAAAARAGGAADGAELKRFSLEREYFPAL
jgi:esterase/lipase superfamily enzyme